MTAQAEMPGDSISLRLGAMLIRETIKQPRRTLSKTAQEDAATTWFSLNDEGQFVAAEEDEAQNAETTLVVRTTSTSPTAWQRLLGQLGVPPFQELETRTSTGAVLFVRVDDRLVAWSFGSGSRWISRRAVDPRFGLLVALNAVASSGEGGGGLLAAHLAPSEGGLLDAELRVGSPTRGPVARFDTTSDRLTGVVVETEMATIRRVKGGRSASFEASISTLDDLRRRSKELVDLRESSAYRDVFSYVENVVEETDPDVVESVLTAVWERSDPDNSALDVSIAWWDDIREEGDDRVVTHFRAPGEVRRESVPADERPRNIVLTWPGIRAALEKKYPDSSAAQRLSKELRFFDADDEMLGACQVRDLIVAEPVVDGVEYVLTEGEVFRAASEYLAALDSFLEGLVVSPNRLPAYNGGHEGRYDESTGLTLLDTQLISVEGSRFEPCDLVDDSGRLIFVKRRSRASVMSHLWAQIVTSAILLRRSSAARAAFCDRLGAAGAPNHLLDTIDAGARDLTLVLSILGATDIRQLTLLARIPLRAAVQRLQDLGYTVEIELIPGPGAEAP